MRSDAAPEDSAGTGKTPTGATRDLVEISIGSSEMGSFGKPVSVGFP